MQPDLYPPTAPTHPHHPPLVHLRLLRTTCLGLGEVVVLGGGSGVGGPCGAPLCRLVLKSLASGSGWGGGCCVYAVGTKGPRCRASKNNCATSWLALIEKAVRRHPTRLSSSWRHPHVSPFHVERPTISFSAECRACSRNVAFRSWPWLRILPTRSSNLWALRALAWTLWLRLLVAWIVTCLSHPACTAGAGTGRGARSMSARVVC